MGKHEDTLEAIFQRPVPAALEWRAIESLLRSLGAEISEGSGSRIRIELNGARAVFHRPHPRKEAGRATVEDVRDFLTRAGITP